MIVVLLEEMLLLLVNPLVRLLLPVLLKLLVGAPVAPRVLVGTKEAIVLIDGVFGLVGSPFVLVDLVVTLETAVLWERVAIEDTSFVVVGLTPKLEVVILVFRESVKENGFIVLVE